MYRKFDDDFKFAIGPVIQNMEFLKGEIEKLEKSIEQSELMDFIEVYNSLEMLEAKQIPYVFEKGDIQIDILARLQKVESTISELVSKIAEMANYYYAERKQKCECLCHASGAFCASCLAQRCK